MCDPVVFSHLQCGIDPRTSGRMECDDCDDIHVTPRYESANESSFFHVHPCAKKSLKGVACLVFPFSSHWPTLLTCSGRASMTASLPSRGGHGSGVDSSTILRLFLKPESNICEKNGPRSRVSFIFGSNRMVFVNVIASVQNKHCWTALASMVAGD